MQSRTGRTATAGLALVALALLACSTRVDQVVTRYRLDLSSPNAAAGARCWDSCINESNPTFRAACLGSCPGVEAAHGEGCETDGRKPGTELCHTHVFATRNVSDESVQDYAEVAGALTEVTLRTGGAIVMAKGAAESAGSSTASAPSSSEPSSAPARPRKPAEPRATPSRNHKRRN